MFLLWALDYVAEDASLEWVLKENKLSKFYSVFRNYCYSVLAIWSITNFKDNGNSLYFRLLFRGVSL